ncbi:MAG: YqaE/Pmp3 family membrane protein [Oceanicaulis sp.]
MAHSDSQTHSRSGGGLTGGDIFRLILAIILPPLGVFTQVGFGLHFWINIVLTLLGYIPGIIHAVYIIATRR